MPVLIKRVPGQLPIKGGIHPQQGHSRKDGNPGRVTVHGETVHCIHRGKWTRRYAVGWCNIESGAGGMVSQTGRSRRIHGVQTIPCGEIFTARSVPELDSRLPRNDVVMPSILCLENTGVMKRTGGGTHLPDDPKGTPCHTKCRTEQKGARSTRPGPSIVWRPQPDLNRCCRRERPMSWTGLDDGDVEVKVLSSESGKACQELFLVGRAGLEPATLCLKGRYSTF